jgi:hypothetical protein
MTTKQIAESVGRDERSVQRWIKKAACKMQSVGDKMSSVGDKMSSSTSTYPADYTLEETLAIIEAGMGKNAAGVYRASAQTAPAAQAAPAIQDIVRETISAMLPFLVEAVRRSTPSSTPPALPPPPRMNTDGRELSAPIPIIQAFLDNCCAFDGTGETHIVRLWSAFLSWQIINRIIPMVKQRELKRHLGSMGYRMKKYPGNYSYSIIGLHIKYVPPTPQQLLPMF